MVSKGNSQRLILLWKEFSVRDSSTISSSKATTLGFFFILVFYKMSIILITTYKLIIASTYSSAF